MANVIFTGPAQKPRDPSGGLGEAFAKLGPAFANSYVQDNALQDAVNKSTSPQDPTSIEYLGDKGVFQDFPAQSNVPTQMDPQKFIQNLISTSGGRSAFFNNQDALLKAMDYIGQGSGGLDPATQAQLFGSASPKQQLPVEKEVSPQQTPAQEKLIAQIDKIDARTEVIKSGSTESDDPFVKAYNAKNLGSTEEQQAERKSATLEGLERMRKNLQKSMGEESIDKKTGAINVGMEKEGGQLKQPAENGLIIERTRLQESIDKGMKAAAIKASRPRLNKNVVGSLDSLIDIGKNAQQKLAALNAEAIKSTMPIYKTAGSSVIRINPVTQEAQAILKVAPGVQALNNIPLGKDKDGKELKGTVIWDPGNPDEGKVLTVEGKPAKGVSGPLVTVNNMPAAPAITQAKIVGLKSLITELDKAAAAFTVTDPETGEVTLNTGFTGPLDGIARWFKAKTGIGFDPEERKFANIMINSLEQKIRDLSGAEVPEKERDNFLSMLPDINSPDEVFIADFNRFYSATLDLLNTTQRAVRESGQRPILEDKKSVSEMTDEELMR